jgi:hypothetical protein
MRSQDLPASVPVETFWVPPIQGQIGSRSFKGWQRYPAHTLRFSEPYLRASPKKIGNIFYISKNSQAGLNTAKQESAFSTLQIRYGWQGANSHPVCRGFTLSWKQAAAVPKTSAQLAWKEASDQAVDQILACRGAPEYFLSIMDQMHITSQNVWNSQGEAQIASSMVVSWCVAAIFPHELRQEIGYWIAK